MYHAPALLELFEDGVHLAQLHLPLACEEAQELAHLTTTVTTTVTVTVTHADTHAGRQAGRQWPCGNSDSNYVSHCALAAGQGGQGGEGGAGVRVWRHDGNEALPAQSTPPHPTLSPRRGSVAITSTLGSAAAPHPRVRMRVRVA